jgi:hypothetical protein
VLEQTSTWQIQSGGTNLNNPSWLNFVHTVIGVTTSVTAHLVSLPVETLEKLHDDSIEICTRIQQLYEGNGISYFSGMFVDHRSLILKLISSRSWQLKMLGWRDLKSLIEVNIELRPYPQAYLVEGAGLDFVNGVFVTDPKKRGVVYVQQLKSPEKIRNVTLKRQKMGLRRWTISSKSSKYYENIALHRLCPNSGWMPIFQSGVIPAPKLTPLYLWLRDGRPPSDTLEHDSLKWIVDNNVLELAAQDCDPNALQEKYSVIDSENYRTLSSEASKVMECILDSILSLFDLILQTLPVHSDLGSIITADARSKYETVASRFATKIMQHFLLLSNNALDKIGVDFISKACESLQKINKRIENEYLIDFYLFRGFLLLRLLMLKKAPKVLLVTELEELSGVCLNNCPPEAFIVEGAGSDIINGRYVLEVDAREKVEATEECKDTITYTKSSMMLTTMVCLRVYICANTVPKPIDG